MTGLPGIKLPSDARLSSEGSFNIAQQHPDGGKNQVNHHFWTNRFSVASVAVTALAWAWASWTAMSWVSPVHLGAPGKLWTNPDANDGLNQFDPKLRVFVWDESWRMRTGRLSPGADDWRAIFASLGASGVRRILIPDEEVFSGVNAAQPGYVQAFRDAAAKGIEVYAPLRMMEPRPGQTPADPMVFGMPVERFVRDADAAESNTSASRLTPTHLSPTSLLDLQKIPDISGQVLAGPAAEFADAIAGVGLIDLINFNAMSNNSFLPVVRWREDRFVANLALAPRDFLWGVSIRGGKIEVANRQVQSDGGYVLLPPMFERSAPSDLGAMKRWSTPAEPIDVLLGGNPLRPAPDLLVIGASNSGAVAQIHAIANAAMNGSMPSPISSWSILTLALAAIVALCLSVAPRLDVAMALGLTWTLALFAFGHLLPKLMTPPAISLLISSAIPVVFETIRRSRLRDLRIRKMTVDLSNTQLAKSAMAQQARMVVHDLRRAVKFHGPENAAYLDGFLVELAALEESFDGKSNLTSKSFSIVDITEASLSRLLPSFDGRGLKFTTTWEHHSRMSGDPMAMRRIIDNLLDNALSSAPRDSTITIRTREVAMQRGDGTVPACLITVGNRVPDFSDTNFAVLGNIRVRDGLNGFGPNGRRRGLGLVIIRRLAESMGGMVRYQYDPESSILEMEVSIPVDRGLPDLGVVLRSGRPDGGLAGQSVRRLIVVVDDSPFVRDMWERESTDADVIVLGNPDELLARLADDDTILSRAPILVIDYHFEGVAMDGVTLARKAREAGVRDIIISSDWDLGKLETNGAGFPVIQKGNPSVARVMAAIQKPSA